MIVSNDRTGLLNNVFSIPTLMALRHVPKDSTDRLSETCKSQHLSFSHCPQMRNGLKSNGDVHVRTRSPLSPFILKPHLLALSFGALRCISVPVPRTIDVITRHEPRTIGTVSMSARVEVTRQLRAAVLVFCLPLPFVYPKPSVNEVRDIPEAAVHCIPYRFLAGWIERVRGGVCHKSTY